MLLKSPQEEEEVFTELVFLLKKGEEGHVKRRLFYRPIKSVYVIQIENVKSPYRIVRGKKNQDLFHFNWIEALSYAGPVKETQHQIPL